MTSFSFEKRLADINRFYEIIDQLDIICGGKRILANCHGRMDWPKRGVYFFFEPGEMWTTSGSGMRVVRVGTRALKKGGKSTLWNRLSQHQGTQKTSGGNHRGSVFRLHVGTGLINRDKWTKDISETWAAGPSAPREVRHKEQSLEQAVSHYIRQMPFLWMDVDDEPGPESLRGSVERNAIALLSNHNGLMGPIDPPSVDWLGCWAKRKEIKRSGLWNVNHVDYVYNPGFLGRLNKIILTTTN